MILFINTLSFLLYNQCITGFVYVTVCYWTSR